MYTNLLSGIDSNGAPLKQFERLCQLRQRGTIAVYARSAGRYTCCLAMQQRDKALCDHHSFAPCTGCLEVHLVLVVSLATVTQASSAEFVCWAPWHSISAVNLHQQHAGRQICMQRHNHMQICMQRHIHMHACRGIFTSIYLSSPLLTSSHLTLSQFCLNSFHLTSPNLASHHLTSTHLTSHRLTLPHLSLT